MPGTPFFFAGFQAGYANALIAPPVSAELQLIRGFLLTILPSGVEVILGQDNRVPEPTTDDFVVVNWLFGNRLATNIDAFADVFFQGSVAGTLLYVSSVAYGKIKLGAKLFAPGVQADSTIISYGTGIGGVGTYRLSLPQTLSAMPMAAGRLEAKQEIEAVYQFDVHGPNSQANARIITTLFRDEYAVDFFRQGGDNISPLYADDARQIAFENENQQIERRWSIEAHLQTDEIVTVPQQFMDQIKVHLIEVDTTYKGA